MVQGTYYIISSVFQLVRKGESLEYSVAPMTWIKTVPLSEASAELVRALESQRCLYPREYATPVFPVDEGLSGIVASHSLIPDALYQGFCHIWRTHVARFTPHAPAT